MRAIIYGLLASFFFAFTFILNRAMELSGGSWMWASSLRYFFMIPLLLPIVSFRKNLKELILHMKQNLLLWLGWSFVGFGLFYAPLTFAAAFGPAWLVAGTWQFTIIAGSLLVPLFYEIKITANGPTWIRQKIPARGLLLSSIILLGIVFMQVQEAKNLSLQELFLGIIPVIIACFAYPLGNRKMMAACAGQLDAYQRVLGMTLASTPFWIILSIIGFIQSGPPSFNQTVQSFFVAISSGIIATVLFFTATDMAHGDAHKLAAVEATQSFEVVFTLIGEVVVLAAPIPSIWSLLGIVVVMLGMILHSYASHEKQQVKENNQAAI